MVIIEIILSYGYDSVRNPVKMGFVDRRHIYFVVLDGPTVRGMGGNNKSQMFVYFNTQLNSESLRRLES